MSWNYRVMRHEETVPEAFRHIHGATQTLYSIREVYYDKDGKPDGFCEADVADLESVRGVRSTLALMQTAFNRPLLDEATMQDIPWPEEEPET